eukprot:TRINITY_DN318_c0_g2_i1.p1 TRINITY_DN318_c0_g2~~TRINITY_DN318_c0_g2_i1.p1  ORF type:complete len:132 (-),score=14.02 TRINITY_DN318_c0_g2_i1:165-560(-)
MSDDMTLIGLSSVGGLFGVSMIVMVLCICYRMNRARELQERVFINSPSHSHPGNTVVTTYPSYGNTAPTYSQVNYPQVPYNSQPYHDTTQKYNDPNEQHYAPPDHNGQPHYAQSYDASHQQYNPSAPPKQG